MRRGHGGSKAAAGDTHVGENKATRGEKAMGGYVEENDAQRKCKESKHTQQMEWVKKVPTTDSGLHE